MKTMKAVWLFLMARIRPDDEEKSWRKWVKGLIVIDDGLVEGCGTLKVVTSEPSVRTEGDLVEMLKFHSNSPQVPKGWLQRAIYLLLMPTARWYNPLSWRWLIKPCYWPARIVGLGWLDDILEILGQLEPEMLKEAAVQTCQFADSVQKWRPFSAKLRADYHQVLVALLELIPEETETSQAVCQQIEWAGRKNFGLRVDLMNLEIAYALFANTDIPLWAKELIHAEICQEAEQRYLAASTQDVSIYQRYADIWKRLISLPRLPYEPALAIQQLLFLMSCPDSSIHLIDLDQLDRIWELTDRLGIIDRSLVRYGLGLFLTRSNGGGLVINSQVEADVLAELEAEVQVDQVLAFDLVKVLTTWEQRLAVEAKLEQVQQQMAALETEQVALEEVQAEAGSAVTQ